MRFIIMSTLLLSSLVSASPSLKQPQLARGLLPRNNLDAALNRRSVSVTSSSSTPVASPTALSGSQTSLTLLSSLIGSNLAQDGLNTNTTEAGEVASLTSTNNYINWCATLPQLPITNGQLLMGGSCNPVPMGAIPSTANMPSSKFATPYNLAVIPPNTTFEITLAVRNFATGFAVNPVLNYFAAPQQLDPTTGLIQGHAHVVIEALDSLSQTTPTNPKNFVFFAVLIAQADANGYLYTNVTGGLPEGVYRMSSTATATNHQPALLPVAERGVADDVIYFTVSC